MIQRLKGESQKPQSYHRPQDTIVEVPTQTTLGPDGYESVYIKKRSLRSKRTIFTIACTAFTIGALMIFCTSPYSKEFLVPGGLTSNHAQITAGQGADRCANCHSAANGSFSTWVASVISKDKAKGKSQSELCMKCHDKTISNQYFNNPHNVDPTVLAKKTDSIESSMFDARMGFNPPVHNHQIACSACHREHHGANHDLLAMTDAQCQSCHKNSYHSFGTDHPEFVSYPLTERSGIAFDHNSHSIKHFPGKNTPFNCSDCHVDDSFQNVKKLLPFEQSCGKCHNEQILESSQAGLAVFQLPMIDTNAIEDFKLYVGSWPLAATGDFDGELSPIMKTLLRSDAKAAEVLDTLGPEFEFCDIDPEDETQVKHAVELIWAVKRLLYDLALNGPRGIRSRLEQVTKTEITDSELQKISAGLDEVVFQSAVRRWLPNLAVEVSIDRYGNPAQAESRAEALNNISLKRQSVGWWPAEDVMLSALAIQEDDLLATNPLKGLMKPLTASSSKDDPGSNLTGSEITEPLAKPTDEPAASLTISESNQTIPSQRRLETESPAIVDSTPSLSTTPTQPATSLPANGTNQNPQEQSGVLSIKQDLTVPDDPELLAVNPLQNFGRGEVDTFGYSDPKPTQQPEVTEPPKPVMVKPNPEQIVGAEQDTHPTPPIQPIDLINPERSDGQKTYVSGWYRDDTTFKVHYIPNGHADNCLTSWINLTSKYVEHSPTASSLAVFNKLTATNSVGQCRACHTVDQISNQSLVMNWKPKYRDPAIREFTKFAHGPHTIRNGVETCKYCHELNPTASNQESFLGTDCQHAVSNFHPLTKKHCASCHSANESSSSCTQCHSYHVGSRVTGIN